MSLTHSGPSTPNPSGSGWKPTLSTGAGLGLGIIASLLIALLALAVFAWLANGVLKGESWQLDSSLRSFAYLHSSPALTVFMRGISALGSSVVLVLFSVFLIAYFWRAWRLRAAFWLAMTMVGAFTLNTMLKNFFERPRPAPFHIHNPASYSFPSGHALLSFCFYFVAAGLLTARMRNRNAQAALWTGAALLVTAIGASRIYLGVHYPSDVLAGYAAAAIWVVTLILLHRRRSDSLRRRSAKRPNREPRHRPGA